MTTPEEHYARGLHLLACAESDGAEGDWARAQVNAAIAHGHFSAAAAGTAMRAFVVLAQPEPADAGGREHQAEEPACAERGIGDHDCTEHQAEEA